MHKPMVKKFSRPSKAAVAVSGRISKRPAKRQRAEPLTYEERVELRKLSEMLPIQLRNSHNNPCEVLNETTCYISQLLATIHSRVRAGSLPHDALSCLSPPASSPTSTTSSSESSDGTSPSNSSTYSDGTLPNTTPPRQSTRNKKVKKNL